MTDEQVRVQMAMAWERAKGELRSIAIAAGHRRLCEPMTLEREKWCSARWQQLDERIEKFITDMDDEGMTE